MAHELNHNLNVHVRLSIVRFPVFSVDLKHHLFCYFVCASSEGSGENADIVSYEPSLVNCALCNKNS